MGLDEFFLFNMGLLIFLEEAMLLIPHLSDI